jgi:opacity protein-like surface antigen
MGKKIILATICLLVSMSVSEVSVAGDFYVSGNAGLIWLGDTDLTENNMSREVTFDSGFGFGGGGGYDFDFMRAEAEIVYRRNNVNKVSTVEYGTVSGSGDMSSLCFMVNGFYDFKNTTFLTPYIGAGIGVAYVDMNDVSAETIQISGDGDTVFAYQAEIGFNNVINETMSFDLGYRYFATTDPSFGGGDAEYKSHNILIRFRYDF